MAVNALSAWVDRTMFLKAEILVQPRRRFTPICELGLEGLVSKARAFATKAASAATAASV
jgi:hypothetical protein